jgi:hypothetical protein
LTRWMERCFDGGVRAFPVLTRRRHVDFGRVAATFCRRSG